MSRELPQDIHAEKALISTACSPGNEAAARMVVASFNPDAFIDPSNRCMWDALTLVLEENREVNPFTLQDALTRGGAIGRVGGFQGIVDRLSFDEVGNPEVLCEILERKYRQRRLITLGMSLANQAWNDELDPDAVMEDASAQLVKLFRHKSDDGLQHISQIIPDARAGIEEAISGRKIEGVCKTHFPKLDTLLGGGFHPGNLIILAARPGIGKTALALNWLLKAASSSDRFRGAVYSLEMSREEVTNRVVSAHAGISLRQCIELKRTGIIPSLRKAYDEVNALPIYISDRAEITAQEIKAGVEHDIARNGKLDLLIVDYLQLISSPRGQSKNPKTEAIRVGEISRAFKLLAKDHEIPVVVLSQLNREVEKREGGLPQLSDLRDSGAIEQDADIVMFIHRSMKPKKGQEADDRSAKLVIAKHRNGPTGLIQLDWDGGTTRYTEIERTTDEPAAILQKKGHVAMDGWEHMDLPTPAEPEWIASIPMPEF